MQKTTSECVQCDMPCLGRACPNYSVTRYYCDKCGAEETLYHTEDGDLCADCILENLPKVEGSC